MSISETIDKLVTCKGNSDQLETEINKLYDYVPEEHHGELDAVIEEIQDLQGCIEWAKEEAQAALSTMDHAYSTIQNVL